MSMPAPTPTPAYGGVGMNLPPTLAPADGMAFRPGTNEMQPKQADGGLGHFLRFVLVWLLMGISCVLVVGIIWVMISLASTGRRKRDILMFLIPVWGVVVQIQTLWRYSAKNVYWSVRTDRPSKSLFAK